MNKDNCISFQIIDANLNRIREGMRCVEEAIRYDAKQNLNYSTFRTLRHNFSDIEQSIRDAFPQLLESRDIQTDRGTDLSVSEKRMGLKQLVQANVNRVSEGLRVVEEYLKLESNTTEFAEKIKNIRYDWYSLDQQLASVFLV